MSVRIFQYLLEKLVDRSPTIALNVLRSKHRVLVERTLNHPDDFRWNDLDIPPSVLGFEDLTFLFYRSKLNRGLLRQDFDEAAALYKAVSRIPNARGIEIGRFRGGSTFLLATAVGPNGHLVSVDIDPKDDQTLVDVLTRMKLISRVELLVADANQVECNGDLDFVFIDGDHSYEAAKKDHNKWGAKVRPGGFVIHHDMGKSRPFSSQWESLAKLRSEIISAQQDIFRWADEAGSMMVFERLDSPWQPV